jgi:AraC family transcriptional regulator
LLDYERPGGHFEIPGSDDLVLHHAMVCGVRVRGDSGGGLFDSTTEPGVFFLAAPNFDHAVSVDRPHQNRTVCFPMAQWRGMLDEATGGVGSVESIGLYRGAFRAPAIQSALRNLWALCDEEGAPSRLLVRAAGCEVLAELFRQSGSAFAPAKGGLSAGAQRRCIDLMRAHLGEDLSLDQLAAEARLSVFHFARMSKHSVGVPPRVYLTRLRIEKACELLEHTDYSITAIAHEVGYSSNQVLARVFCRHQRMSPERYRRAVQERANVRP